MRQRKLSKLVTKNKAKDSSGDATDLVTGRPARTVGTSEDPQNYFLGKQLEKFPGLDIENAWRSHPISEDAAITVMNAETFVEACTYRTFGAKVYYLPYVFGRLTPKRCINCMAYCTGLSKTAATQRLSNKRISTSENRTLLISDSGSMSQQSCRIRCPGMTYSVRR